MYINVYTNDLKHLMVKDFLIKWMYINVYKNLNRVILLETFVLDGDRNKNREYGSYL